MDTLIPPEENDDGNGTDSLLIDRPNLERMWSLMVHFEPCPDGMDLGEYCQALRAKIGGTLHDLGHVEWYPLSLQLRIECTTASLQHLFTKKLWKRLHVRDVQVENLDEGDIGGEGGE